MTIASQTSRIAYTGDGATTAFAVPFYFSANADLVVSVQDTSGNVTTKLLGTDYSLTGATIAAGGTCTFTAAPATGVIIAIYRVPPITQTTSYNNNDPFPAKSHELALDKATTVDQYLKSQIDRAILVAPTDTPPMATLPPASVRALKNFTFDSLGNPTVSTPVSGTAVSAAMIPVITASTLTLARAAMWDASSVMSPVVTASTLAIARAALGVGSSGAVYATRTLAAAATIDTTIESLLVSSFASSGDGGAALYKRVAVQPTHSAKFQSADGAWWEYVIEGALNILQFGGVGDGATPNDAAFAAAFSLIAAKHGGALYFPPGKYLFTAQVALTNPAVAGFVFSLKGDGPFAATLYWPNASNGLKVTSGDYRQAIHIEGLAFTTFQTSGNAIDLVGFGPAMPTTPWSSISNVQVSGDDTSAYGFSKCWGIGIRVTAWSQINFYAVNCYGLYGDPNTASGGQGVVIQGRAADSIYGILYNIVSCSFNYLAVGFVYGDWVQGVTFNGCNFNGVVGTGGILAASGATGVLSQLAITNCQFNTGGNQIALLSILYGLQCSNNTFTVGASNATAIYCPSSVDTTIIGNFFNLFGTPTNTTGVTLGGTGTGIVSGNLFVNYTLGVNMLAGTSNIYVNNNSYPGTSVKTLNSGTNPTPGTAAP